MSTTTQLPPLNNLPQWSRANNTLDRARYPKPFLKDRLHPLPSTTDTVVTALASNSLSANMDSSDSDKDLETDGMNAMQRIHHLEKSIKFLRHQHQEVLANLHVEIEQLKRENKELHFKLIMAQQNSNLDVATMKLAQGGPAVIIPPPDKQNQQSTATNAGAGIGAQHLDVPFKTEKELSSLSLKSKTQDGSIISADTNMDELKHIFYEDEIKELKDQLRDQKQQSTYFNQLLDQEQNRNRGVDASQMPVTGNGGNIYSADMLHASTNPLQVHPPQQAPRPPTLQECEVIIRHLQHVSEKQSHELNRLKSDLRDVLYSHKWTPDAFLLAKAYVAEDESKEGLPRLQLKNSARKLPEVAYVQREAVVLPALTQTMGNKATERRKRTQILQKARLRKEVLQ